MSKRKFRTLVDKASEITRDDLATYLCLTGWSPRNEAGRKFTYEGEDCVVAFDLGTCNHDTCFVRDLLLYQEIRETLDKPHLSFFQIVDHIEKELHQFEHPRTASPA